MEYYIAKIVREGGEVKKSAKVGGSRSTLGEEFRNIEMDGLSLEGKRMKMAQTLRQSTHQ